MKAYFIILAAIFSVLMNACTKAEGMKEAKVENGSFSFDGVTYQVNKSSVQVDPAKNKLRITLYGSERIGRLPKLTITIDDYSGEGDYQFSESVNLKSSVTEDGRVWDSRGCAGKVKILTTDSGTIEGVVEGYLTTPYENSFIPTRIKSNFKILEILPNQPADLSGNR